jgi:hypothetical protein
VALPPVAARRHALQQSTPFQLAGERGDACRVQRELCGEPALRDVVVWYVHEGAQQPGLGGRQPFVGAGAAEQFGEPGRRVEDGLADVSCARDRRRRDHISRH